MLDLQVMESLINEESEMIVLGTVLDNQIKYDTLKEIDVNVFSKEYNKGLFKAMKALLKVFDYLDLQLVHKELQKANSPLTVSNLTNILCYSNKYTFHTHLNKLRELQTRRNMYERAMRLADGVLEGGDLSKLMFDFEEETKKDTPKEIHNDDISSIGQRLLEELENPIQEVTQFGIKLLDDTIGGIFPGELTTIGAKSGCGKSTLALQIIKNALDQNKTVLLITREMTDKHMVQRLITQVTGLQAKAMKTRNLNDEGWTDVMNGLSWLGSKKLYINDTISKPSEIRRRVKQVKPDLVVVDYLQLLTSEKTNQGREQEVAYLSREMKKITLDFKCAVIQLTQLNDSFRGRPFGESAVRESKSIYHDANNVIYLHKPMEFEEMLKLANGNENLANAWLKMNLDSSVKVMELIVSKARDGNSKVDKYMFLGDLLTFQEIEK